MSSNGRSPMFSVSLVKDAEQLLAELRTKRLKLATAETCTGGLIAALLTEVPGSSEVVERGFVAVSNDAKVAMLGVPEAILQNFGPASKEVAVAMAEGAFARSGADVAVAATGIANPGSGPAAIVHIAAVYGNLEPIHQEYDFGTLRGGAIHLATAEAALQLIRKVIIITY